MLFFSVFGGLFFFSSPTALIVEESAACWVVDAGNGASFPLPTRLTLGIADMRASFGYYLYFAILFETSIGLSYTWLRRLAFTKTRCCPMNPCVTDARGKLDGKNVRHLGVLAEGKEQPSSDCLPCMYVAF